MRKWEVTKCKCGHPACDSYYSTPTEREGRMSKEDALLVSAAPELLETLEHIVEYWNRDQNEKAMTDALWHIIDVAEEAIAKATKNGPPAAKHEGP